MIDSEAWRELGAHEVAVYLMLKHMFYKTTVDGAVTEQNSKRLIITFAEAKECLKISGARFKKAIDKLEAVGLIDVVQRSRNMKHANIYGLSARWQEYKAEKPGKKWPLRRIKDDPGEEAIDGYVRLDYRK